MRNITKGLGLLLSFCMMEAVFAKEDAPENVFVVRDVEYAQVGGEPLLLDLYCTETTEGAPPLIVWFHGGDTGVGGSAVVNKAVLRLAGDGYFLVSVDCWRKDGVVYPGGVYNGKAALRWIYAHADEYGYDPEKVIVAGASFGGYLATMLGMSQGVKELEGTVGGHQEASADGICGIINFYGSSDLSGLAAESSCPEKRCDKDLAERASPLAYLTPDDPPMLIIHGDADKTVPLEQGAILSQQYQDAGLVSELMVIKNANHGGSPFESDEVYNGIFDFLEDIAPLSFMF